MSTKATVVTPGGRVGNDRSTGSRSNGENWVEQVGGLPRYIRIVRNGLMKDGRTEGQATALAVAAIKRWARGGDNVSPKVQAAAAAALAEWEAKKKLARKSLEDALSDDIEVSDEEFKAEGADTLLSELHDHIDNTTEVKDATMTMEFKTVGVVGQTVDDAEHGIVTTFVSVTGLQDNVKDVIHPGAYEKSLKTRTPKGVWSHSWDTPVSKTLAVKELQPGDPSLPQKLPNGQPWPRGAGALKVKTQFNLDTQRGREAYSDVIFFGDQQEWSIGYQVPVGGARIDSKTGVRHIDYLELYEYSPVLFGAMSAARTASPAMAGAGMKSYVEFDSVRDAQCALKSITMSNEDFKAWADELGVEVKADFRNVLEVKGYGDGQDIPDEAEAQEADESAPEGEGDDGSDSGDDPDLLEAAEEDWTADEEDDEEEKALSQYSPTAYDYDFLVKTRAAIDDALATFEAEEKEDESDDRETKSLLNIIERHSDALGDYEEEMKAAAEAFDTAFELEDAEGMDDFGNDVLEVVEKALDAADEEDNKALAAALQKVAAAVASMAPMDEEDLDNPEEVEDEDDTEKKPIPPRPTKKDAYVDISTKELDAMRVAVTSMLKR